MTSYEETHPWITFKATDVNELDAMGWMMLGEARSKCEHLAGAALQPGVAQRFYTVAMVKGAHATTAIEGNTLTDEEVEGIHDGTFDAPPSREYQEREVKNVLRALEAIDMEIGKGRRPKITVNLIKDFHKELLDGTEYEDHVVPGEFRSNSVAVASYKAPPAEDVPILMERLATWLESDTFRSESAEIQFALSIACAVYAHLYVAWIHPFGDGNGRTARLLEFLILARCGQVPLPAAHLLANHYNLTRDRYYRELAKASASRQTTDLIKYAVQGLVDGLRDQISEVRDQQLHVTWINYVHETMSQFKSTPSRNRQRDLVLAMPADTQIARADLTNLTPALAAMYAVKGARTLSRDLNQLHKAGLITKINSRTWKANNGVLEAFLPTMAQNDDISTTSERGEW